MERNRLYDMWSNMKQRCSYKKRRDYRYYGGKGVKVCDEWHEYKNFEKWALENGYKEGLSIDRIDFDGNYEPLNCRFVEPEEQQRNKSNNVNLTHNGKTQILSEWAREYNIHCRTLKSRLELGYTIEQALNKEKGRELNSPLHLYKGEEKTLTQWADLYNMSTSCLFERLKRGWSIEKALETPVKR